jgi:Na+/H+ antiporter NhaD/arsenite permease-like protein
MKQKGKRELTHKETRKTAVIVAGVLILAALLFLYRSQPTTAYALAGTALLLVIIGLFAPPAALLFHRVWMGIAHFLGYVNSRILLTLVYLFIFVPYGIVSRLAGRDPLFLRQGSLATYWHKRAVTKQTKDRFERLF